MRIAVINYSYGIGSTGRLAQQIEENANPERYQFQFFCKKAIKMLRTFIFCQIDFGFY